MRIGLTSGSLFNGLAIIGTGAAVMLPDQKWIGGLIIAVGVLALVFDIKFERGHVEIGSPRSFGKRLRAMSGQFMMLVGALMFLVGAAWYFLPYTGENKNLPSLTVHFVPEAIKGDDVIFHLSVTNDNAETIELTRLSYATNTMSDVEVEKNKRRSIPPKVTIDYPGLPINGVAKGKRLAVHIEFKYWSAANLYTSKYIFAVPENAALQNVNPMELSTEVGASDSGKDQINKMLATLNSPRATIELELPEKRPDGSANNTNLSGNNRFFSFDPVGREVTFTVVFSPENHKSLMTSLIGNQSGQHKVAFSWDDEKKEINLAADGVAAAEQLPAFHLELLSINVFQANMKGKPTGIGIDAKIWNTGAASTAVSWGLTIIPHNGPPTLAQSVDTPEKLSLSGSSPMVLEKSKSLDYLTSDKAVTSSPLRGTVLFLTDLSREIILNNQTTLQFTVKDIYEKEYSVRKTIAELKP
jgi:hypothetical protein